jgi:hypothetical protein
VQGKVELADSAETLLGTDTTRATHPAGVKAAINKKLELYVPFSHYTSKGTLLAGANDADGVTEVAVGTNGQVLTADSAEFSGVKWAVPPMPNTLVADWNDAITPGFYYGTAAANAPSTDYFTGVVEYDGLHNRVIQTLHVAVGTAARQKEEYRRVYTSSWSAWIRVDLPEDTGWVNLASYLNASFTGTLWGRRIGSSNEIYGSLSGTVASGTTPVDFITTNPLPAAWRSTSNRWGTAYSGGYNLNVVVRADGTMGFGNRTGSSVTTPQFSISYFTG